jgi:hypothetical protein
MTAKLGWIEVLNEQAEWRNGPEILNWLSAQCGYKLHPSPACLTGFEKRLEWIRQTVEALHFGETPKLDWLDEKLKEASYGMVYENFLPESLRQFLPLLHGRVANNSDDAVLNAIADTLLLQFSQFLDRAADGRDQSGIARCQGVFRESANFPFVKSDSPPSESELRWRKEIELLNKHDLANSPEVQRCTDLFIASAKARFCSDACRFASFQLAKHLGSPGYHAEKQKRYRKKQTAK